MFVVAAVAAERVAVSIVVVAAVLVSHRGHGISVFPRGALVASESVGAWTAEVSALPLRPRSVFRDIEAKGAARDFPSMELLNRLLRMLFGGKPNERESSGTPCFTVLWNVNVNDFPDLSE